MPNTKPQPPRTPAEETDFARKLQNGSIHRYIGFSFAALVLVLLWVAR